MNAAVRKPEENGNGKRDWLRAWPVIAAIAALIGWGYVTAYRVNANEEKIEKNSESIDEIKLSYSEIDKKLSILIERQQWENNKTKTEK